MDPHIERAIAERAESQLGHLTRRQARQTGLSTAVVSHRARTGRYDPVGNHTLRLPGAPRTVEARVMAACLDLGGVASHRTAAWLHGLDGFGPPRRIEVTVRKGKAATASPLAQVHTTTNLSADDMIRVGAVPTTSVARTFLGLAALVPTEVSRPRLLGAVEAAVRDRQASDRWLWWRLEALRCRGRNGVAALESVLAERAGLGPTESWLERETLRIIAAAGLPLPTVQTVIRRKGAFVARVDFLYEPVRTVIEVKGNHHHSTPSKVAADESRVNALQLAGYTVLQFSYDTVVRTPGVFVATIDTALAGAHAA